MVFWIFFQQTVAIHRFYDRVKFEYNRLINMNSTYQNSDYQSLEYHQLVVAKLKENPRLVQRAIDNIKRWKAQRPSPQPYYDDWLDIINQGFEPLLKFLVSETDEAQRLRSSSPFVGINTQTERMDIWKKYHDPR